MTNHTRRCQTKASHCALTEFWLALPAQFISCPAAGKVILVVLAQDIYAQDACSFILWPLSNSGRLEVSSHGDNLLLRCDTPER